MVGFGHPPSRASPLGTSSCREIVSLTEAGRPVYLASTGTHHPVKCPHNAGMRMPGAGQLPRRAPPLCCLADVLPRLLLPLAEGSADARSGVAPSVRPSNTANGRRTLVQALTIPSESCCGRWGPSCGREDGAGLGLICKIFNQPRWLVSAPMPKPIYGGHLDKCFGATGRQGHALHGLPQFDQFDGKDLEHTTRSQERFWT